MTDSDVRELVASYRKDADLGDVNSQYLLGEAYLEGKGVVQSNYKAYVWFLIAKAGGHEETEKKLSDLEAYLIVSLNSAKEEAEKLFEEIESRRNKKD